MRIVGFGALLLAPAASAAAGSAALGRLFEPLAPTGRSSVWESHPALAIVAIVLFALLVAAVASLLVFRRLSRKAMQAVSERLEFERLVSELSAELIEVDADQINQAVEQGLRRVLDTLALDRCALFVILSEKGEARPTHAANFPGAPRLAGPVSYSEAPYLFDRLFAGHTVVLENVLRDLPPWASADRQTLADRGVKSLLLIPVTVSEQLVRGISLQTIRSQRDWPPDLAPRLRLVGQILFSAVVGKRAEAALRASEERYREVVDSQTDLICRYLPDTTLTFVNEAYCRYFGRFREELIGRQFLELIPEEVREVARQHVKSLVDNPRIEADEHEVVRADGSIGWQQWVDYAVRGRDGRVIEFQAIGRDITDRKRAEEADRRAAQVSRLALLGELTASIAHEINQPLGAILSNADALEMLLESTNGRPEEIRTILSDIRREGLRASEVVSHVRTLVRRRAMEMTPLDVNEVAEEVMGLAGAESRRRGVVIETEFASDLPEVRGDRVWLHQLFLNLIVNAMDAMGPVETGKRRLLLRTCRDGDGRVEVAVADTGHGIPAGLLPRLFESFVTTREDGMGLGLAISRSIVEAHGGRIRAENNPGGGATLRFTLPADGRDRRTGEAP